MPPRNLSWEEILDDKSRAITKKRLEIRIQFKAIQRLMCQQEFFRNLSLKFRCKILRIRDRENIGKFDVTPEISIIQQRIDEIKAEIQEYTIRIQALRAKEAKLREELNQMKRELRQYLGENVQAN